MAKPKKNPVALFFLTFLKTIVIMLAILIVVLGLMLYKKVMDEKKYQAEHPGPVQVDDSILTEIDNDDLLTNEAGDDIYDDDDDALYEGEGDDSQGTPVISSADLKIAVLNGTDVKGLAGAWKDRLAGSGYNNVSANNYFSKLDNTKIIVAEEGMGEDLKAFFPNATFEVGTLAQTETDVVVSDVKIFIIIGNSDDIVSNQ